MAGSSFWDSVYDAMPSTRDIGSWLGYVEPYASPMYGVERTQTGIRPTDTSYGFLDLAGDIGGSVWDAGKKAISWGGRAIESDTFKNIMNIAREFQKKGAGDEAFHKALQDMAPKGTQRSGYGGGRPISGFVPGGRKTPTGYGAPSSYNMVDAIKANRKIMERMWAEVAGIDAATLHAANKANMSVRAYLKAISVKNPYTGTRIASSTHKIV